MLLSEFDIQATLYTLLKEKGYNVTGEYKIKTDRNGTLRADIAILDTNWGKVIYLIEVKDTLKKVNINTRQYKKYKATRIKFDYCLTKNDIQRTIQAADLYLQSIAENNRN